MYATFAHTAGTGISTHVSVPGAVTGATAHDASTVPCPATGVAVRSNDVIPSPTSAGDHDTPIPNPNPCTSVITGDPTDTAKLEADTADSPDDCTVTLFVDAPTGTLAEIDCAEFTVNEAATDPNSTEVAPANPDPVIATWVPTGPVDGVNEPNCGVTVNDAVDEPANPFVVTFTNPDAPSWGTVAVACVSDSTENDVAAAPPKETAVAPVNPVPVTVTGVPTGPEPGVTEVTFDSPTGSHATASATVSNAATSTDANRTPTRNPATMTPSPKAPNASTPSRK